MEISSSEAAAGVYAVLYFLFEKLFRARLEYF